MSPRRKKALRRRRLTIGVAVIIGLALALWGIVSALPARPLTPIPAAVALTNTAAENRGLALGSGAAAVGTLDGGLKLKFGDDRQYPTASIAKTITMLTVLNAKPLTADEAGPTITMTTNDEALWQQTVAANGTNIAVTAGEKLTERQMINGIMLRSANNLADSLAVWAFGSMDNYRAAATSWLEKNGLKDTVIGPDASGLDPATRSTVSDMFKVCQLAMQNPALRAVVVQTSAAWPDGTQIVNTNPYIGKNGYIGIKSGHTDAAGYTLLSANSYEGKVILAVVLGQQNSGDQYTVTDQLVDLAKSNFSQVSLPAGTVAGKYVLSGGREIEAKTDGALTGFLWTGDPSDVTVNLDDIKGPQKVGTQVGTATLGDQKVNVSLADSISRLDMW